jgi:surface polysaccharide O-acyltransferase-like enzyme
MSERKRGRIRDVNKAVLIDPGTPPPQRQYDIDWLRTLAMGAIFLFHCARFFDDMYWHVKNPDLSHPFTIFVIFTAQWVMPLFFILSGFGVFFALKHRSAANFIRERFLRLVVPLVFGIFVLIPPQVYIERLTHDQFIGSFFAFYPHYFDGWYGLGGNFAWMGLHLWYLEVLFIFSIVLLPFFFWAKSDRGQTLVSRAAAASRRPGFVVLLCVPLFFVELLANTFPGSIGVRDFGGWSPLVYVVFFVVGFLMAFDDRFGAAFETHRRTWLILGVTISTAGITLIETGVLNGLPRLATVPIESVLRVFNSWFWLMAILGFGRRYLSFTNRGLAYANRAVLPFYILHQTVIVIIAFFLIGWAAPVPVKYIALALVSFAVIVGLYEGVIRRIGVLRFLFGMKKSR